jgi:hypothetical protein
MPGLLHKLHGHAYTSSVMVLEMASPSSRVETSWVSAVRFLTSRVRGTSVSRSALPCTPSSVAGALPPDGVGLLEDGGAQHVHLHPRQLARQAQLHAVKGVVRWAARCQRPECLTVGRATPTRRPRSTRRALGSACSTEREETLAMIQRWRTHLAHLGPFGYWARCSPIHPCAWSLSAARRIWRSVIVCLRSLHP